MQTLTDRPRLWNIRRAHLDRLAMLQLARSGICGCVRCNDELRGEELDVLIALSQARIREVEDAIMDATRPPDASTSNGL